MVKLVIDKIGKEVCFPLSGDEQGHTLGTKACPVPPALQQPYSCNCIEYGYTRLDGPGPFSGMEGIVCDHSGGFVIVQGDKLAVRCEYDDFDNE